MMGESTCTASHLEERSLPRAATARALEPVPVDDGVIGVDLTVERHTQLHRRRGGVQVDV